MKKTSTFQNGLIWFGAGVSLAEILTGTAFAPLGMAKGLAAIVIGHIIGCAMMLLAGLIGGRTGPQRHGDRENELWTEESLEQAGGRETILAIPDSHSIVVYGILDGNLVIYGGTYYEDAQKQEVLDAINIMLQTTEIE